MPVYVIIRKPVRSVGRICHTLVDPKGSQSEFYSNYQFPNRCNIDISLNRLMYISVWLR